MNQTPGPVAVALSQYIVAAQPNYWVLSLVTNQAGVVIDFVSTPVVAWRILDTGGARANLVTPIPIDECARPDAVLYPDGRVVASGQREFEGVRAWFEQERLRKQ